MKYYGRAQETANRIVEAFKSGDLAEPLAQVYLTRVSSVPMAKWSYLNLFSVLLAGCTDARGYRQWLKVGRKVKPGQKAAAYILVPLFGKKDETKTKNGRETTKEISFIYGFKGVAVFDISQTEGEPVEQDNSVNTFVEGLPLVEVANEFGLDLIPYNGGGPKGGALGWYSPGASKIGLGVENWSTWAHELVHAADDRVGNLTERGQHYASETVAELGGAVLLKMLGHDEAADLGGAWKYISTYAKSVNKDPVNICGKVIGRVCEALDLILETAEQVNGEAVVA